MLWHVIVDNIGNEIETDIVIRATIKDRVFLHMGVSDSKGNNSLVKSFEGSKVSIGNYVDFEVEKLLPGKRTSMQLVVSGPEIPKTEFWSRATGWAGPITIQDIKYVICL